MKKISKLITFLLAVPLFLGTAFFNTGESRKAEAEDTTYTFTSNAWADATNSWISDNNALSKATKGVQVTAALSGAGATSKAQFSNITKISVNAATTASGVGSITVKVGDGEVQTICSLNKSSTSKDYTLEFATAVSGKITFVVNCSTNSLYLASITTDGTPDTLESVNIATESKSKTEITSGTLYNGKKTQMYLTGVYTSGEAADVTNDATWESSNTTVATVSKGLITCKEVTTSPITITATYEGKSATYNLTIVNGPTLTTSPATYTTVFVNTTYSRRIKTSVENFSGTPTITAVSANPTLVIPTINANGTDVDLEIGNATENEDVIVTVTATHLTETDSREVKVKVVAPSFTLSVEELNIELTTSTEPSVISISDITGYTDDYSVSVVSSNTSVFTAVLNDAKDQITVTPLKTGDGDLTVTINNGTTRTKSIVIPVSIYKITSISNANKPDNINATSNTDVRKGYFGDYEYIYYGLQTYDNNSVLELNKNVNSYIANNKSYECDIKKVVIVLNSSTAFEKFTLYEGNVVCPSATAVARQESSGTTGTYILSGKSEYFCFKLTTTGTWYRIYSIDVYLGGTPNKIVNEVSISDPGTLYVGDEVKLNATVTYLEGRATDDKVTWSISGDTTSTIDNEGNLSVNDANPFTVTATSKQLNSDGNHVNKSINVTPIELPVVSGEKYFILTENNEVLLPKGLDGAITSDNKPANFYSTAKLSSTGKFVESIDLIYGDLTNYAWTITEESSKSFTYKLTTDFNKKLCFVEAGNFYIDFVVEYFTFTKVGDQLYSLKNNVTNTYLNVGNKTWTTDSSTSSTSFKFIPYKELGELTHIEVNLASSKTKYYQGDTFDKSLISVTAYDTDGYYKEVGNDCVYTNFDLDTLGTQTVTVSYTLNEQTVNTTFDIKVIEKINEIIGEGTRTNVTIETNNMVISAAAHNFSICKNAVTLYFEYINEVTYNYAQMARNTSISSCTLEETVTDVQITGVYSTVEGCALTMYGSTDKLSWIPIKTVKVNKNTATDYSFASEFLGHAFTYFKFTANEMGDVRMTSISVTHGTQKTYSNGNWNAQKAALDFVKAYQLNVATLCEGGMTSAKWATVSGLYRDFITNNETLTAQEKLIAVNILKYASTTGYSGGYTDPDRDIIQEFATSYEFIINKYGTSQLGADCDFAGRFSSSVPVGTNSFDLINNIKGNESTMAIIIVSVSLCIAFAYFIINKKTKHSK